MSTPAPEDILVTQASANSTFARAAGAALGSRVVTLGDSLTIGSEAHGATESLSGSWPAYAGWLSGQKFRVVKNAGVGGNTSAQMLARFDTDVTPFAPTLVTLLSGTNDMGQNVALSAWQANVQAIVAKIIALGAKPVLFTIPPRNDTGTYGARVSAWNLWLRSYALAGNIPLIDANALLTDPASGQYKAAYNNDGVHPSKDGYAALGRLVSDTLSPLLGPSTAPFPVWNADPSNRIGEGLFLTDVAAADGLADGWAKYGSGTYTPSLVPADVGNWQQWVISAGTWTGVRRNATGTFTAGDRVRCVGKFDTTGGAGFQVQIDVGGTAYYYRVVHNITEARVGAWDVEFTLPTGATGVTVTASGNVGTHKIAQVGVYNLTALGLA